MLLLGTLAHQAQLVVGVPGLHHLALRREAEGGDPLDLYLLAAGRHAPKISLVGASYRIVAHHLVPFCDLVLDGDVKVGESRVILPLKALYVLRTTYEGRAVGLVGDVALEDLVHYLKVILVADLLQVASEDSLVLFGSGHAILFSFPIPRFHFRKICSITEMLPAQEAWRISGESLFTGVRGSRFLRTSALRSSRKFGGSLLEEGCSRYFSSLRP